MDFEQWKQELINHCNERTQGNDVRYEDFKNVVDAYNKLGLDIKEKLKDACERASGQEKYRLSKLYRDFTKHIIYTIIRDIPQIISTDYIKHIVDTYKGIGLELQNVLKFAADNSQGDARHTLRRLYKEVSEKNISNLYDKLNSLAYSIKQNDKSLADALNKQIYRLMEKTRLGLRSEVANMLVRAFAAQQKAVPELLMQVFNPIYTDEEFKVLMYSFLGGIIKEKDNEGGQQS